MKRRPSKQNGARIIAAWLAPILLAGSMPAGAVAMFTSSAEVRLLIADITPAGVAGLNITGGGTITQESAILFGSATGTATGTAVPLATTSFGDDDDVVLNADTAGSATLPGDLVIADALVDGSLRFENTSTETFSLSLSLAFALTASIMVDDPVTESASALAALEVVSDRDGVLLSVEAFADSLFGPLMDDNVQPLDAFLPFVLAPGEVETVSLFLTSSGFAEVTDSTVLPEPATVLLLVAGLVTIRLRLRRCGALLRLST